MAGNAPVSGVLAEDIFQGPRELARGEAVGLSWSELHAASLQPVSPEARYTSTVLKTSFPFTHLGLHWRNPNSTAQGLRFEVRASRDGWSWPPWQPAAIEEGHAPAPRGETFANLITEDRGRFLQYRAFFDTEAALAPRLEYVVVTALDASAGGPLLEQRGPSLRTQSSAEEEDLPVPPEYFLSREQWGADERLRFYGWNLAGEEIWPRRYIPTKKIVVHHTATLGNLDPRAPGYPYPSYSYGQAVADVRAIYYYHAVTREWGDIGYNALIDRFGRVFEGRYGRDQGRRELLSAGVEGGHVKYCNHGADGVSLIGHFEYNDLGPTEQQNMVSALLGFLEWDARRHGISPTASSNFLRVDWQWLRRLPNIPGHRDCSATTCPGRYLYARLPGWRRTLEDRLRREGLGPTAELSGPDGVTIPDNRVSFTWDSEDANEFSHYLEGWIADVESGEVTYIEGFTSDKRPDWSPYGRATSASLGPLRQGRYTFHVRAKDASGSESAFEANRTFVVSAAGPQQHTIGVPGLVKS